VLRPLYIVGTQRDVGKTTLCIGLIDVLRRRGLRVGYTKPLGQRVATVEGRPIHDDARLISSFLALDEHEQVPTAIPLPSGRVEKEVRDLDSSELGAKVVETFEAVVGEHDVIIIEGMGHVAMGSCLGLSSAEVARRLNAVALLVTGGGIGRTLDDIALCSTFITARGADLMGVVINKVWPEKYRRVREATAGGLKNYGMTGYGVVPFEQQLASPTMQQIHDRIGGEILSGPEAMTNRVHNTIIAAMEPSHMVGYLEESTLIIAPGDRSDNILASLSAHTFGRRGRSPVAGLILTGGFRPDGVLIRFMSEARLPVVLVRQDTYSVASRLHESIFKITPEDQQRIDAAVCMVSEYIDVDGILKALEA